MSYLPTDAAALPVMLIAGAVILGALIVATAVAYFLARTEP